MASKGGSRNSKHVKKWFGKNGKLKPEFTKRSDAQAQWDNANAAFQGSSKNQRWKAAKDQALAERSLVASGQGHLIDSKNFSPAITSDMIKSIGAKVKDDQGLGEIAHSRPADDFLPTSTQSTSTSQAEMQTLTSNASSTSQTVPEALPEETRSCPCDEPEKPEGPPIAQKDPSDYTGDDLRDVLRSTFNHDDFRPGQQEAVSSVLAYKKTLLLLSTGSGKSLCYQIPAYLLREEGLTLVISPLLSLMQDQLNRLPRCLRGAIVSSQQTREQCRRVMRMVRARYIDVLYISPERLSMWAFDGCGLPPIALACIDEAHCVSEWSHNFRPDYLRLNEFLTGSLGARRLLALTATATRPTIKSVYDILDLDVIVRSDRSFLLQELLDEPAQPRVQRTNLTMDVKRVDGEEAQLKALVELLRSPEYGNRSTIVYVWRKFTADQLSKKLRTYLRLGVHAYHAGLSPETRRATQAAFMDGTARIVVATMAFGMGLDKPDIRVVIHYSIPKSIEHYVQETGRCSRDGEPGHCIALVNKQEFKSMRWLTSGNGGNSGQASIVRRLMALMFGDGMPQEGRRKKVNRFQLSAEAVAEACNGEAITDVPESWQPYYVAFDEAEVAKELNIQQDELHSVLAHFAHRARGHIVLHSKFPTKMKLRFFKTDPAELAQSDPLLRKVLPLAKKVAGVHTLDTAQALASLGGQPSRLSKALWGAQGDEFSVEKADYGYMVAVLCPADEALVETWVADIVAINQNAHRNGLAKLDAAYCALVRATEASDTDANMSNPVSSSSPVSTSQLDAAPTTEVQTKDAVLAHLIDAYFSASSDPSGAVAGDGAAQRRMLREALGDDYSKVQQQQPVPGLEGNQSSGGGARDEKLELESAAVYSVLARLIMDKAWPTLPSEDPSAMSHAASQFLAGIGTPMLPAKKWKEHRCWGKFKEFRDFELLEELVGSAYHKLQALRRKKSAPPS
jgi:ATP-dependent DNA helicase Q4